MGVNLQLKLRTVSKSIFTFYTSLLVTAVFFNNYLIWFLRFVWFLSGNIRQLSWNWFLSVFGDDQFTIWVTGTSLILIVEYWVIGGLYTFMDLTLSPKALRKFKIQPGTNEPLDKNKLIKVIKQVLFNQVFVGLPTIYLGGKMFIWRNPPNIKTLPPFHWMLLQFFIFLLIQEFSYYYIHRLLHYKRFYTFIHKKHHEWSSTIALSAIYCHPIEQVIGNMFPLFLGCFIFNVHLTTYLSWFALAVLFTLSEHSGYHLPFMTSPEFHDFHHLSYINNFGFLGILDSFHKTDTIYKKSKASKRHFILKGYKSARELIPDGENPLN